MEAEWEKRTPLASYYIEHILYIVSYSAQNPNGSCLSSAKIQSRVAYEYAALLRCLHRLSEDGTSAGAGIEAEDSGCLAS